MVSLQVPEEPGDPKQNLLGNFSLRLFSENKPQKPGKALVSWMR